MTKIQHFYNYVPGWFNFQEIYSEMVALFPDNSKFVEVGSWKGKSSSFMATEIINSGKNIEFYCVDTWEGSPELAQDEDLIEKKNILGVFCKNVDKVISNIKCIQLPSIIASRCFDFYSLDFVFIDANHSYKSVKQDINAWLPKVKRTGYIGGHDIDKPGVLQAVNERFGNKYQIKDTSWLYKV